MEVGVRAQRSGFMLIEDVVQYNTDQKMSTVTENHIFHVLLLPIRHMSVVRSDEKQ